MVLGPQKFTIQSVRFLSNTRRAVECPHPTDAALDAWCIDLKKRLRGSLRAHRPYDRASRPKWHNLTPLVTWAMKTLHLSQWTIEVNDKDGGFSLMTRQDHICIHKEITAKFYKEVNISELRVHERYESHFKLARRIAGVEGDPDVARLINRSLTVDRATFTAWLRTTCKSHKEPGRISHRNLHTCPTYAFKGLSKWVARQIQSILCQHPHILRNSADFVQKISLIPAESHHYFVKLDLKDFYMSGSCMDLTNDVVGIFPRGPRKSIIEACVIFLLDSQFIQSKAIPGLFKVETGTGMGLIASGDLADAAFYHRVEAPFATAAHIHDLYGIIAYFRFKHDIFIIGSVRSNTREFIWEMQRRAGYFTIELDTINSTQIRYLELLVTKGVLSQRFLVTPTWKPTSLGIPLCTTSTHPFSTHRSWPISMIKRLGPISSTRDGALGAKRVLVDRFRAFFAPSALVDMLESTTPSSKQKSSFVSIPREGHVKWFLWGYHPATCGIVASAFKSFLKSARGKLIDLAFGKHVEIKMAWYRTLPNIAEIAMRHADKHV